MGRTSACNQARGCGAQISSMRHAHASKAVLDDSRAEAVGLGLFIRPRIFMPETGSKSIEDPGQAVVLDDGKEEGSPKEGLTALETFFLKSSEGAQGVFQIHRAPYLN